MNRPTFFSVTVSEKDVETRGKERRAGGKDRLALLYEYIGPGGGRDMILRLYYCNVELIVREQARGEREIRSGTPPPKKNNNNNNTGIFM
jgi:hypothetical protein